MYYAFELEPCMILKQSTKIEIYFLILILSVIFNKYLKIKMLARFD